FLMAVFSAIAIPQTPFHRSAQFEEQPAVVIGNDKLELTLSVRGAALVNLMLRENPEAPSPLWNPIRMARELGQAIRSRTGSMGHFGCVDGFGGVAEAERAAGLPGHGEAQTQTFDIRESKKDTKTGWLTLHARLPLVQED